jgi:hypothetical protein
MNYMKGNLFLVAVVAAGLLTACNEGKKSGGTVSEDLVTEDSVAQSEVVPEAAPEYDLEALARVIDGAETVMGFSEGRASVENADEKVGVIDKMGSDDLLYTPDVVVFKTDERTDPIIPCMMDQEDWYKVDVITCAAPELHYSTLKPQNYEEIITRRIKKILDVAARERVEVLILGAWGCGAFGNDIAVVSKAFYTLLENYDFQIVEFALGSTKFFDYFQKTKSTQI